MPEERRTVLEDTKVRGYQVTLVIDTGCRAWFEVTLGEGNVVRTKTLEDLGEKIDEHEKRQERRNRKKINIPFLLWTDDEKYITGHESRGDRRRETPAQFVEAACVGVHAGTGHPILKIGKAKASQEGYFSSKTAFRPMTEEQKEEWKRLVKTQEDAEYAQQAFCDEHGIYLTSWLKDEHKLEVK